MWTPPRSICCHRWCCHESVTALICQWARCRLKSKSLTSCLNTLRTPEHVFLRAEARTCSWAGLPMSFISPMVVWFSQMYFWSRIVSLHSANCRFPLNHLPSDQRSWWQNLSELVDRLCHWRLCKYWPSYLSSVSILSVKASTCTVWSFVNSNWVLSQIFKSLNKPFKSMAPWSWAARCLSAASAYSVASMYTRVSKSDFDRVPSTEPILVQCQ